MTVSTIVDTATRSAVSQYPSQAGPVVARLKSDLDAHLAEVAEKIVEAGVNLGARREQVESLLVDAGLVEPTPEPEPEAPVAEEDRLGKIESTLARLVAFAERHGL